MHDTSRRGRKDLLVLPRSHTWKHYLTRRQRHISKATLRRKRLKAKRSFFCVLAFTQTTENPGVCVPGRWQAVEWHSIGADHGHIACLRIRCSTTGPWVQRNETAMAKARTKAIRLRWHVHILMEQPWQTDQSQKHKHSSKSKCSKSFH